MDYAKALTFVTEDERWQTKIAIGTGVMIASTALSFILVGFLGFFIVIGYCIRLLQNVQDGQPYPLPEWDEWGEDLIRGLKYAIVGVVWALPLILFSIPLTVGGIIADSGGAGEFFGVSIMVCGSCLMLLYGIFVLLASPGFTIAFSQQERISEGLQISQIWAWTQANLGPVIVVALAYFAVSLVLGALGMIVGVLLCGVGILITVPLASLLTYIYEFHLFGQLAWQSPYGDAASAPSDHGPEVDSVGEDVATTPLLEENLADEEPDETELGTGSAGEADPDETDPAEESAGGTSPDEDETTTPSS